MTTFSVTSTIEVCGAKFSVENSSEIKAMAEGGSAERMLTLPSNKGINL